MAYAQIEVSAPRHPKVLHLSDRAFRLWVTGLCYCQEHLTDGVITSSAARTFGVIRWEKAAEELVAARLWLPIDAGWRVHDYDAWNHTRAQVEEKRKRWREKKRLHGTPPEIPRGTPPENPKGTPPEIPGGTPPGSTAPRSTHTQYDQDLVHTLRAREATPSPLDGVADDLWQSWRQAASTVGLSLPLSCRDKDRPDLCRLAAHYRLGELEIAMEGWFAAPAIEARFRPHFRAFASEAPALLSHLAQGGTAATYRAQPAGPRAAPRVTAPWRCPHSPPCHSPGWCQVVSQRAAEVAHG